MAFSTNNVQVSYFGNMKIQVGEWTCNSADAPGTVSFDGGRVWFASFESQDATGVSEEVPYSVSGAGPITVTVYSHNPVATGRYIIIGQ